jgi:hypothetical protein
MSLPSNCITAEVIRETLPEYHPRPDLPQATFAAMPPLPAEAMTAWRRARITRWIKCPGACPRVECLGACPMQQSAWPEATPASALPAVAAPVMREADGRRETGIAA